VREMASAERISLAVGICAMLVLIGTWLFSFLTGAGNLDPEVLKTDVERLTAFYYDNGYVNVKVDEPQIERKEDGLEITIRVEEGEQFKVGPVKLAGDVVGFGARALGDEPPKYLNSPETALYHKSKLLYGLDRAKKEMVRTGKAVVTEGYTDVIALHKVGVTSAVATCGTALGEDHFATIKRFCDRVVLAFDADAAGSFASERGFGIDAKVGVEVLVASIRQQPIHREVFTHIGVDLASRAIVALKSSAHFRAGFQEIAEQVIVCLAPGANLEDPGCFAFAKIRAGVRLRPAPG